MKIAFITDIFPALGATFILDQIVALINRGHELHIIADASAKELKVHDKIKQYNLARTTFYTSPPSSYPNRVLRSLQILTVNLPRNIRILRLFNIAKYGKHSLGFSMPLRAKPFLENKYDIIHCHFGQNGVLTNSSKT